MSEASDIQEPISNTEKVEAEAPTMQEKVTEESKEVTQKPSETEESKKDDAKTTANDNPLKIRKRAVDGSTAPRGFSMRQRGNTDESARRAPIRNSPAPSWANKPKPTVKPTWIKDEDYKLVHNENSEPSPAESPATESPARKLKRPSRRGNVDDQVRRAQMERERENVVEQKIQEEITRKKENLDQIVRQHYNQRAYVSKHSRRHLSPIIKLRNFNNAIKYMLIGNFSQPGWRALDLGCGKGGDINKWSMANISEYIGIDISNASIVEAIKRYNNLQAGFETTFITGDCFGQPLPFILKDFPHIHLPVDIVSMQFCMHYAFETEIKARTLLENVSRSLRAGGYFIGTIPSSDFITEKVAKLPPGEKKFGNSIYSVTFENDPPRDGNFRPAFGNMYTYFLRDAIDNVPEYVVPFEALRALAEEFDLELTYKKTFLEMFKEEIPTWFRKLNPRLVEGMRRTDGTYGVEGDESEASAFYLAFAFQKAAY